MQFLADENAPGLLVRALRRAGHDVAWIREDAPSSPDEEVLARSVREQRVLLTFDRDFGQLVFSRGAEASAGIVLVRGVRSPDALARFVLGALESRGDWAGHFSVIEPARIRMRSLPPTVR